MTPRLLLPLLALLLLPGCAGDPSTTTLAAPAQPPQPTRDRDGDGLTDAHDPTPLGFDGSTARQQPMGAQLHLHGSLSEFDGTMMYHTAQAEALGVDLIWWSDHDALISMMNRSRGFDWDEGSMGETLEVADLSLEHGFSVGSNTLGNASQQVLPGGPSGQGYYLQMEGEGKVDSDWRAMRLRYVGEFFAHQLPLLSDATVQLSVNPTTALGDDWRFQVVFLLSGNMGGTRNNIVYYLANEDLTVHNDVDTLYVPMTAPQGVWTTWTMPISADAEAYFPEMDDQSAQTIYVELMARNSAAASIDVDDLVYAWSLEDEKLRQRQVEVLADRYSDGNVTHFVGQEITLVDDGKHVNPLGEDIPLPDYHATGTLSLREATNYVHDHGGVAVCNHPFGIATRVIAEGDKALDRVALAVEAYRDADGFGCDAVEVGYRARVVDLDHHLLFWDTLSSEQMFLTGIGTSDHHLAEDWLEIRNPFLTWIFLDTLDELDVAAEIEAGRAFFGDPGPFVGEEPLLDIWSEHGALMGQVLRSDLPQVVHVELGYLEAGWTLALVVDGELYDAVVLDGDESELVFSIDKAHHSFVRAELWDAEDVPILMSNPVYQVPEGWRGVIPPARLPAGS